MTIPIIENIKHYILNPIIALMFAVALFEFVLGLMLYIRNSDSPAERKKGFDHIVWGSVGMAIMLSVYGILQFVANTVTVLGTP